MSEAPVSQSRFASPYPLTFRPVLKRYPWGGDGLATHLGRNVPPGQVAESWEISAHPNGLTHVSGGAAAGKTLPDLLSIWGEKLVGYRNAAAIERGRFPVLIKLLDAAEWLSVQVHPDDAYALEHEGDLGKTEMWVVLHAEPRAELIQGFEPGVAPDRFKAAVKAGGAGELLHRVPVRAGDVFFLRPGTIHAIGPGILLTEIQQSSDVTYRVHDWDREDAERPLHLERALDVLDFSAVEPGPVEATRHTHRGLETELLASCPYFETHRLQLAPGASFEGRCDGTTFEAWAVIKGDARLVWAGGSLELEAVQWVLLPAALGDFSLSSPEGATLLRVITPEPPSTD